METEERSGETGLKKNDSECADGQSPEPPETGDNTNLLREAPVWKLVIKLSLPAIVGMLFNAIYNIVDRAFIGHTDYLSGDDALTALQLCFPPMMILFGIALIFGIGGSVVFSIALGKHDHETAKAAMGNAFVLSLAVFAMLTILSVAFAPQVMSWFIPSGTSENTRSMAVSYIRIIAFGLMFQSVNVFGNNFIRADGRSLTSMVAIILGAAVNTVLDYVFIFPLRMGIEGAALATIIGQGCSTLWILYYFFGKKSRGFLKVAHFRLEIKKIRFRSDLVIKIVVAGFSAFVLQAAGSILMNVLNFSMAKYAVAEGLKPEIPSSAMGVINSVQTILVMPLVGLNHGLNPIMGQNYGARQPARVKTALMIGVVTGFVFTLLGWGAITLFPAPIIAIFNAEAAAYTQDMMATWLSATLLLGISVVGGNYFQATGKSVRAMLLSLLRQVIVLVPLILLLPMSLGLRGIFYAQPISDAIVTVITVALLAVEFFINPLYRKPKKKPELSAK